MAPAYKKLLLSAVLTSFSMSYGAEKAQVFVPIPESAVEKYQIESQYGPETALLNPAFGRDGKWEFSGGYAYSPFSSLVHYKGWSGNLTIHINRRHAFEPLYFVNQSSQMTPFVETQIRDKIASGAVRDSTTIDVPKQSFAASYLFSPFYSKMHITERTVTHFDVFLGVGAGVMKYNPLSLSGAAGTIQSRPTGLLTMGMRFLFPSRFGLRLELRDFIHSEKNFGKTFTANSLQISLSTSLFFGAF